jgi:hypothetical protein
MKNTVSKTAKKDTTTNEDLVEIPESLRKYWNNPKYNQKLVRLSYEFWQEAQRNKKRTK